MTQFGHRSYSIHAVFSALAFSLACGHAKPNASNGTGNNSGSGGSSNGSSGANGVSGSGNPGAGTSSTSGGSSNPGGGANGVSGSNPGGGNGAGGFINGSAGMDAGGTGSMTTKMSCGDASYSDAYMPGYQVDATVASQVSTVVSSMSVADKAGQMQGAPYGSDSNLDYQHIFAQPNNTTQRVAGFKFRDGPRGVNLEAGLAAGKDGYSTVFPVTMARGASFDLDLELRIGDAIGDETLASGNTLMLAPAVNILRHPAWGRAQETYGEDPFLLGRMGSAFTVGVQHFVPA